MISFDSRNLSAMDQSGFCVTLSFEFRPAGIGVNAVRALKWGATVSLPGRRLKAVDSFEIGAGRFSPAFRFKEPTRQCQEERGGKVYILTVGLESC